MKKPLLLTLLLSFLAGCVGPDVAMIPSDEKKPLTEIAAQQPDEPAVAEIGKRVLFYAAHSEGDAVKLADVLEKHPNLKVTLLFPPKYFNTEEPQPSIARFKVLQSSGQIEIALTLDNQPILPLLYELSLAGKNAANWRVGFSWPSDVGGQIALGLGAHQKRWGALPSGFYPPYLSLSPNVAAALKQFRFDWVLGKPGPAGGANYVGSTAFIAPVQPQAADVAELVEGVLAAKIVFVDGSMFETPAREVEFLTTLANAAEKTDPAAEWINAKAWVQEIQNADLLASPSALYEKDFSQWFLTERQRLAWVALSNARGVIEDYQNSGRANLKRLDAALEEMYSAESGDFLLALGQAKFVSVVSERSFLATLANVYRLCGQPVPPALNTWFNSARWKKAEAASAGNDERGPFYVDGTDSMKWNDAAGDEGNGERKLVYPLGKYAAGAFDLRSLRVSWDESTVKFAVDFGGIIDLSTNIVLPLTDIYLDVNKLSGAGAQDVIPGRRGGGIHRDAAWEYALAISPIHAVLYQAVPGGTPRVIERGVVSMSDGFTVSFPRAALRGNPKQWRLTAAVSGTESRKKEEISPVPVGQNATDRMFGGGPEKPSASYVDVLNEAENDQKPLLSGTGSDRFTLPFVEVP